MNKALSFVRLDFITVKPYWKQLLVILGAPVFMTINTGGSTSGIVIAMMMGIMIFNFPFAIGSKNNIDALYIVLALNRNTVVLGRYLFTLAINIYLGAAANIITFIIRTVMQKGFDVWTHFIFTAIMILACSIVQAVQLPIFFKFGYEKARLAAYLPLFVIIPVAILIQNFISQETMDRLFEWYAANQAITAVIAVVLWLSVVTISYLVSASCYKKRDF